MISLTCTSCKKTLEIDDAFAGGVCRCQFCGTIQTVPASLKKGARPGTPGATPGKPKTLYQKMTAPKSPPPPPLPAATAAKSDTPTTDASKATRAAQPTAPPSTQDRKRTWMIGIAIGAAAAVLIGIIAWIAS